MEQLTHSTTGLEIPRGQLQPLSIACTEAGRHKHHPRMQAEPWKGTHFLSPFSLGLAVIGCGRLPAHSLPCASTALLASKMRDGAKSPPLVFHLLPRGAAGLAAGFPVPGIPHVGLAALGKPGSGTPAVCYPAAMFQLAMLRPQMGAPNSFLAKAAGKTSEVWVFRLRGLSYLTAKGDSHFFPYSYIPLD